MKPGTELTRQAVAKAFEGSRYALTSLERL
jgi:hypothetical protein